MFLVAASAAAAQTEPAVAPELTAAATALGMVRGVERSTDMLNTVQYRAAGTETTVGANGAPVTYRIAKAVGGYSYAVPGGRVDLQRAGPKGGERVIRVVAGTRAWNESTPGVGSGASAEVMRRLADVWITPHGAIRAAIHAGPKAAISKAAGKTVVAVPVDGIDLRIVLNAAHFPEQVSAQFTDPAAGPTTIEANYTGYKDWDGYDVPFPTRVVQRVNGRPSLDLTVTEFRSNPYVVFPAPAGLAAK